MTVKWKLILFSIVSELVKTLSLILTDPDHSPDYFYPSSEHKTDLRRTFLEKRRLNLVTAKRVELIDKYLSNNSVFVDGILHEKIDKEHKDWKLVNEIETAYRNLVGMEGVNYYFKRDPYWRTWRKVDFPEGDKMVCYKCESSLHCSECQYPGYWAIDLNPPCPYEIVSVNNSTNVCAINFKNSIDTKEACPDVATFADIMNECDNPIDTQWRIQKVYKKEVSERYPKFFCRGRDFCEIATSFKITTDHVAFRITNSTNHIIYSKIMKNNRTNYACARDCGVFDPKTKTVSKTDKPLIIDLINTKNKREDKTKAITVSTTFEPKNGLTVFEKITTPWTGQEVHKSRINKLKHRINEMESIFNLAVDKTGRDDDNDDDHRHHHHHHHHDTKNPTCSSMKHRLEAGMSDE